jgi:hypothetical protein
MYGAIPLFPLHAFMAWTGTTLYFILILQQNDKTSRPHTKEPEVSVLIKMSKCPLGAATHVVAFCIVTGNLDFFFGRQAKIC